MCDSCDSKRGKEEVGFNAAEWKKSYDSMIGQLTETAKHWQGVAFGAGDLKGNEIRCGKDIFVKIPQLPGLITRKKRADGCGGYVTYIELVTERRYDKEKKQTRNKRVCIGTDISHIHEGLMIINERYHKYFNNAGELIFEPKVERKEKVGVRDPPENKQDNQTTSGLNQRDGSVGQLRTAKTVPRGSRPDSAEPLSDITPSDNDVVPVTTTNTNETEKEIVNMEMVNSDQELQAEIEKNEHVRDRAEFYSDLLTHYDNLVTVQMEKRPETAMSAAQIRLFNELFQEIRVFMEPFEYGDYLQLAEEADEENGRKTTYGDMAVLLQNYKCVIWCYRMGRIWYKGYHRMP